RHFADGKGWRLAFFIVGVPGLLIAIFALFLPEPQRGGKEGVDEADLAHMHTPPLAWKTYSTLLRNRSYVYNTLGMAMFTFALGAWLADRFARRFKGAYFWVSGVAMIIAAPFILVALITARYGGSELVVFGCIAIGLILSFLNYGPSNAIIINVTVPNLRAAA